MSHKDKRPDPWSDDATRLDSIARARSLLTFIDRSPTPWHAAASIAARLDAAGFHALDERDGWMVAPGDRRYVVRDGSTLVAFVVGRRTPALAGFRILGAHTDSPNLRVKPAPEQCHKGYLQLGVEVYGGALLSTWLDRDLSLAGRVLVTTEGEPHATPETVLVDLARPVARVPNLAIHLNRNVNQDGLVLNKQRHMVPVCGLGEEIDLMAELGRATGRPRESVLGFDLCFYDTQKASLGGFADEFVFASRLDNLASCFAASEALAAVAADLDATAVIALYDHEECGSRSAVGAAGTALEQVLSRICALHPEPVSEAFPRAMARSLLVSADMAHALHPNYADKHDEEHAPRLNGGIVIKTNANQSYATTGATLAELTRICLDIDHEPQHFVVRSDLPCGSTIGPITATRLGVRTVDVGAPMLSMHSCREMCGTLDVASSVRVYGRLFR